MKNDLINIKSWIDYKVRKMKQYMLATENFYYLNYTANLLLLEFFSGKKVKVLDVDGMKMVGEHTRAHQIHFL